MKRPEWDTSLPYHDGISGYIESLEEYAEYLEEQIKIKDKAIFRTLDELDHHERENGFQVDGGLIRALIDATSTDNQP